jgi:hypothetical protein
MTKRLIDADTILNQAKPNELFLQTLESLVLLAQHRDLRGRAEAHRCSGSR